MPIALVAVLGVEVQLAREGDRLGGVLLDLDRRVGLPRGRALRVVWLGDSTAAGVGVGRVGDALPTRVASGLGRPVEQRVLATSGARVSTVVEDQLPELASWRPDVVLVSVGANDVVHLTPRDDFEARYRRLVAGMPEGADVVLLGIPEMGSIPRLAWPLRPLVGFRGGQLDEVVVGVAGSGGASYVDIAGETGSAFRRDPERFFASDDYHPSADGYQRWAEAVLEVLRGERVGT